MKLGILISGRGSNMVAIVDAVRSGEVPSSEVAVVISDKADAAGLAKARERGVETVVIERNGRKRAEHDAEIISELRKRGVELVCLAGYMRLLSPDFVQAFPNKIINIHPSLLPAFPGLDVHQRVLDAGEKFSGCTVHYVDEFLDNGPTILQQWVSVERGDNASSLSERVLRAEHKLYVEALRYLAIEFEASNARTNVSTRYKVLKSFAHNFSHSFVSLMNYVDDQHVIDEIRRTVREKEGHHIIIDWIPGNHFDSDFSELLKKSISLYRSSLIRNAHAAGVMLFTIKEFKTEIYLLRNRQLAVDGVLTDNRGRTYKIPVTNF